MSPKRLALLAIDLHERLARLEHAGREPLAVVGIGCRFPGGADTPETFWHVLRDGIDTVREVPRDRWDIHAYYDPDPDKPGKMATRWGAFLDNVDEFDADFFGISPREAASMDPQQRILLEVAWEALEHAGISPTHLKGSPTGVFVGICSSDYFQLQTTRVADPVDTYLATGSSHSVASGRLSYFLGLQGPAVSVDTACSSSLTAVHLACRSLRNGECRTALAAGVNVILWPEATISMSRGRMMAPDGRCKTFDARADGFVRGEGCGVIVLKRLSDAEADGDRVLAVIRGSAANQDGKSNGLTAPNGPSQQAVIRQALADAAVAPEEVGYLEAHGTGTPLGDPIEVQALGAVLGEGRDDAKPLIIGSVKTNVGHLEAAAGIAGLIKVVLALNERAIPPHLHLDNPSPHINWSAYPIRVATELSHWDQPSGRRIAGVSSFGFSGSNVHVVLEEAPGESAPGDGTPLPVDILTLSARSEAELDEIAVRHRTHLEHATDRLDEVCYTSRSGRAHFAHRMAVVGQTREGIAKRLHQPGPEPTQGVARGCVGSDKPPRIAFLFPGQGVQCVGMGRQLYESESTFRSCLEECEEILSTLMDRSLLSVLFPVDDEEPWLDETRYTQPALFSLEYALAMLWRSWGVEPSILVGHSLGEFVAACLSGVFELADGLKLVAARGRLSQGLPGDGAMAAVFLGAREVENELEPLTDRVAVAAINGPENTVISGERDAVNSLVDRFTRAGVEVRTLKVSYAGHSPMVDPMLEAFREVASDVRYFEPAYELISNVSGQVVTHEVTTPAYWVRHVRAPVMFEHAVRELKETGCHLFLEVGPHSTLSGLGMQCVPPGYGKWLPSLRRDREDWVQLLETLAQLYVEGAPIDWAAFDRSRSLRKVALPRYPFQRNRYWIVEKVTEDDRVGSSVGKRGGVNSRRIDTAHGEVIYQTELGTKLQPFLADHTVSGNVLVPAPLFLELARNAGTDSLGVSNVELRDLQIVEPLLLLKDEVRQCQTVVRCDESGAWIEVLSRATTDLGPPAPWTPHANCRVRAATLDATASEQSSVQDHLRLDGREMSPKEIYQRLESGGVRFGPRFRGIHRLLTDSGWAVGMIRTPIALIDEAESYGIHPALLDSCFHVVGACLADVPDGETHLMCGLGAYRLHGAPPDDLVSRVRIRPGGDMEETVADITISAGSGEVVAEVEGMRLRRAQSPSARSDTADVANWLYRVKWGRSGEYDDAVASWSSCRAVPADGTSGRWLILADTGGVGDELQRIVEQRGFECVVAVQGREFERTGPSDFRLDLCDQEHIDRLVQALANEGKGQLSHVVHLLSLHGSPSPPEPIQIEQLVALACKSALVLTKALVRTFAAHPPKIWFVTRGCQDVGGTYTQLSPAQAPLWGLGRTIAGEHPEFWGGLVDLDPGSAKAVDDELIDVLLCEQIEDQVVLREGQKLVPRLERFQIGRADTPVHQFRSDSTYLITGATGGIGLRLADWLVRKGARHLALVARSAANQEADQVFAELEDRGAEVRFIRGDVSIARDVASALSEIDESMPGLRGVFHLAGAFDDRVIERLDWPRFRGVLAPKVQGGWNLHVQTIDRDLDVFVLFASGASFLAPTGLANYAAANSFLDALASYRRALGLAAISVDWGPWEKTGMAHDVGADRELQWSRAGFDTMPVESALYALEALVASDNPQVAVLPVDWVRFSASLSPRPVPPLYRNVVAEGHPEKGGREADGPRTDWSAGLPRLDRESLLLLSDEDRLSRMESFLRSAAAIELGMSAEDLDTLRPLNTLGLDSLMAVQLKNRVQSVLELSLPMSRFVSGPNVRELASELMRELDHEQSYTTRPLVRDPQRLLADLDGLSDREVESLIEDLLKEDDGP